MSSSRNNPQRDARTAYPRCTCSCGSVVLFPGGIAKRTCGKCGLILTLEASPQVNIVSHQDNLNGWDVPLRNRLPKEQAVKEISDKFVTKYHSSLHAEKPSQGFHVHSKGAVAYAGDGSPCESAGQPLRTQGAVSPKTGERRRPRFLDEVAPDPNMHQHDINHVALDQVNPRLGGKLKSAVRFVIKDNRERREPPASQRDAASNKWLLYFLGASALLNVGLFKNKVWPHIAASSSQLTMQEYRSIADADGDGVPDQHDLCPRSWVGGWFSGRATDFDADGCADGMEDSDKDNDGIMDVNDKCPFTPQKYRFVSNRAQDFDGDGCADGFEDADDDNDLIPDSLDRCPGTVVGEDADSHGCSDLQLKLKNSTRSSKRPPQKEKKRSKIEEWMDTILGVGLQVVLGALLSEGTVYVDNKYNSVKEQLPDSASGSIPLLFGEGKQSTHQVSTQKQAWAPAMKSHGLRILCYACVYLYLREHRCYLASTSTWFAVVVESVAGKCPMSD